MSDDHYSVKQIGQDITRLIDAQRNNVPRSRWVRHLLRVGLVHAHEHDMYDPQFAERRETRPTPLTDPLPSVHAAKINPRPLPDPELARRLKYEEKHPLRDWLKEYERQENGS